jgi:predicted outer membrane repeat protein
MLVVCGVAWAGTFAVQNTNDSGPGSLRAAITKANANPGRDLVRFAAGVEGTIALKSALPVLRGGLEIRGPGAGELTVRRSAVASKFSVLTVAEGANVTVSGLRLSNGATDVLGGGGGVLNDGALTLKAVTVSGNRGNSCGGGVYNDYGTLTVENSTFFGNSASEGGAICNFGRRSEPGSPSWQTGEVTIIDSTFSGNGASSGGAIHNNSGFMAVEGSTFSGNSAEQGGGILNRFTGVLTVTNSTFSGNTADRQGGAIYNDVFTKVEASTLTENTAGQSGGGIYFTDGGQAGANRDRTVLRMSIVAGNEAPDGPDASSGNGSEGGGFASQGYNLIGDTSGSSGFGPTDLTNTNSGLDPRGPKNNGGPTRTIALLQSSQAIDAVERGCPPPATDQRGVSRPQNGDDEGAALCDIGAFERTAP